MQTTNNTPRPPVSSNVGKQATIQINRGAGALQTLGGKIVSETTSHVGVIVRTLNGTTCPHNDTSIEFFPLLSKMTTTHIQQL